MNRLDEDEISTRLSSADGTQSWLIMLCGRSPEITQDQSREEVMQELRGQRIDQLAEAYLAELRAAAQIDGL